MVNYFCRYVLVILVEWIGYPTQSSLNKSITNVIFVSQFFNTGLILLLIKANFSDSGVPILNQLFNDFYYDFSSEWYDDIGGALLFAMIYSAIWPIIEFISFYALKVGFRILDSKRLCPNKYKTNLTTIHKYVDLYGGSEYLIYWKFSRIINLAWVTFMFGPGIPILYPTFLLALVIQWVVERLCMAYYYKQPPLYDEKLSNNTVNLLYFSVLLQMLFGFWMFTNNQMFANEVYPMVEAYSPVRSGHSIWEPIHIDQAFPFLFVGVIFLVISILLLVKW